MTQEHVKSSFSKTLDAILEKSLCGLQSKFREQLEAEMSLCQPKASKYLQHNAV